MKDDVWVCDIGAPPSAEEVQGLKENVVVSECYTDVPHECCTYATMCFVWVCDIGALPSAEKVQGLKGEHAVSECCTDVPLMISRYTYIVIFVLFAFVCVCVCVCVGVCYRCPRSAEEGQGL
jgi:hypothetical protein